MKRLLLVSPNWMGDVLFLTPAIRAIRKQYPDSHIACLTTARVRNILRNNPHLNEVLTTDDGVPLLRLWHALCMLAQLRKKRFDTAIFFNKSRSKVTLAAWAGIRHRIGFESPKQRKKLTQTVPLPSKSLHRIDSNLHLLGRLGIPPDGRHMEYFPKPEAEETLWKLIPRDEPYVVLHAGGNWELKRWGMDHFVQWIRLWLKEFRIKVILCGTADEKTLADRIQSDFSKDRVLSLCGKTSLDELAHLLKNAEFLLSNDSGPIHLAATQKTKILGIFGPTSAEITGPVSQAPVKIFQKDVGCEVPCYYRSCHYRVCMDWIKPEEVLEQARELMRIDIGVTMDDRA